MMPPSDSDGPYSTTTNTITTDHGPPGDIFYFCSKYVPRLPDQSLEGIKYFVIAFAIYNYIRDGWGMLKQWQMAKGVNLGYGKREAILKWLPGNPDGIVLQWGAYFISHLLTPGLMVAMVILLPISTDRSSDLQVFVDVLGIVTMGSVILYLMFFLQLAPFFGPFIITVMRLIVDVIRFAVLLFLTVVIMSTIILSTVNTKTNEGCIEDFNGMARTMYSVFSMSLNMVLFTRYDLVNPGFVYILHVIGMLFLGILLYNFLIGILSNSVAEMAANMKVICLLQHHFVTMTTELSYWPILRHYYRWIQPRHFTCENGRIYVIRRVHPSVSKLAN